MSSVFISYSRQDYEFVRRLIADLQAEGIQVWIDQQGLQVGTPSWERAIRDAIRATDAVVLIASPDSGQSRYVRGELHIAEMYKRPVYPVWAAGELWAECVPLGLIEMQHTDARGSKYGKALLDLLTALRNVQPVADDKQPSESAPVDPDFIPRNPYKGLRAFTGNDTGDFFGRDGLVNELVDAVGAASKPSGSRFLAIVGPSGSGKSSVVMAGLLPKLQSGALPGSKNWVYLDPVLPGSQPLESLAVILADALHMANSDVLKDLDANARGLHLLARRLTKGRNDARVVLLVDQFEELFTQTMDADKRDHFIDLLVTAAQERDGQLLVILTLRADFYDRPMNYAPLGKLLEKHTKSVLPMSIEDLRDVIEKPAALSDVKLEFEPGLVGDLLFEVRGQTGALPLLQFTLDQLAERRQGHTLTNAAYQDMGGVKGALAKHAESVYQSLPTDQHRELARSLFLRLIEPGATEQDTTRRRATQREIIMEDDNETKILWDVFERFTSARLITTSYDASNVATIEVSHEALIREWERFNEWLRTSRDDLRLQHIISQDAYEWIKRGRRLDDLYRGAKLKEAQDWSLRQKPNLQEKEFIEAATREETKRISMETELQQRLEEHTKLLEGFRELEHLRGNFFAYMSGELRTPLNSIIGFSRVILKGIDGPLTEMQEQDLLTIYNSGMHLLGLINDILDQAKIDAGMMELRFDYFEIKPVVEGMRSVAEDLIKDKPIDLQFEIASDLPKVYGDEYRIRQVLLNLVSNAVKFTQQGDITLRVYTEPDPHTNKPMVRVDVQDTGVGIVEHDISIMFQPFQQVDSSLTRTVGGTGLGLPIAKSLIEMQGGRIWVSSEVNVGSTFSILIPLEPKTISDTQEIWRSNSDNIIVKSPPILLIEENPDMVDQYQRILHQAGFNTFSASIPLEAEAMASGLHPILIIMSTTFPNCWEILKHLKERDVTRDIPIIVSSMTDDSVQAIESGAFSFLQRPFTPDQLLAKVREAERGS